MNKCMTIDELRIEADKLGYNLVKKKSYMPIKPCPICGRKNTSIWYSTKGMRRQCNFCDFEGDWTYKKISVNKAWNNAVERYLKVVKV